MLLVHFARQPDLKLVPKLGIILNKAERVISATEFEVELTLILSGKNENNEVIAAFELTTVHIGTFDHPDNLDETIKANYRGISATSIMFPYVRANVAMLTANSGMQTISLPALDVNQFESWQKEQNQAHNTEGTD